MARTEKERKCVRRLASQYKKISTGFANSLAIAVVVSMANRPATTTFRNRIRAMALEINLSEGVSIGGKRRSRWPAVMDLAQSLSGLLLVLFIWFHMLNDGSILISKDAMYFVSRFMEGRYIFGADYPILVSLAAGGILALIVLHAWLAMRKFPERYAQYHAFRRHMGSIRHEDTTLWWVQIWTGFALFFLASAHLVFVITRSGDIGPYESADRVISGWMWPVYVLLLITVHLHAGIGVYRLAVKWGLQLGHDAQASRRRLKFVRSAIIVFFLVLGSASLAAFMQIGIAHRDRAGERYVPTWDQSAAQTDKQEFSSTSQPAGINP
jgi:fumarate reductase subunit C